MKKLITSILFISSISSFASNSDTCLQSIDMAIAENEKHIHKNRVATYDAVDFDQVALRAEASTSRKPLNLLQRVVVTPAILVANVDGYLERNNGKQALKYLNFLKNVEQGKASEIEVNDHMGSKVDAQSFLDTYRQESVCKTQSELSKELLDSKPSTGPSISTLDSSEEEKKLYKNFLEGKSDILGKKLYYNFVDDAQRCYGDYYNKFLTKACVVEDKEVSVWLIKTKKELLKL